MVDSSVSKTDGPQVREGSSPSLGTYFTSTTKSPQLPPPEALSQTAHLESSGEKVHAGYSKV